uniref:Receptor kinase-like protein Xa21 n=1 Tax=Oryza rufipogon TaxID=4529 RepID=A0A0E0NBJ2_ORYRU
MIRLFASFPKLIPLLAVFIFSCSLPIAISDDTDTDRGALLCFKSQISDPNGALSSWTNTSQNFCNWQGVSCNNTQTQLRVMALNVSSKGLGGSIPPCIGNLSSIASLDLSSNAFLGKIPSELGRLGQISYLNLSINSLEGRIPDELSSCSNLQVLGLWNNSLQGEIPPSLTQCTHLQQVILYNNKLEGRIPTGFGTLRELKTLDLSNNALTGDIPPLLGSSPSFVYVDLGGNQLTGRIPEFLANSSSLQVLRLMQNSLTGEIPAALFNSSTLTTIYLNRNNLAGSIPPVTAIAAPIQFLSLTQNKLTGGIPPTLGNLSSLVRLSLAANNLVGSIPESLSKIPALERLILTYNNLSGPVPESIFNMSSLRYLEMANNSLIGRLPQDIGNRLPNLQSLILSTIQLNGPIPASLANMTKLEMIYLVATGLTGVVPSFGLLPNLRYLDLAYNHLEAGDWSFLSSLANCTQLKKLLLDGNGLKGSLPSSVGNLAPQLDWLWLKQNKLSGTIPAEIGNLKSLTILYMDDNMFSGSIPQTIGNLTNLLVLSFAKNNLSGRIPDSIGNLSQLNEFYLDRNNLNGSIPANIGQWRQLEKLNLSHNSFSGSMPSEVFKISSLSQNLDLSHNLFTGPILPEIGNLINLGSISIANNRLTGDIPSTLGKCVLLEYLHMEGNLLTGSIPQSFMNLKSIKELDLSRNRLSGKVPEFLTLFSSLQKLNLSFNDFEGTIPSNGVFGNASRVILDGNYRLCANAPGYSLPLCPESGLQIKSKSTVLKIVIPIVVSAVVISLLCLTIVLMKRRKEEPNQQHSSVNLRKISYEDIAKATDGFSATNLVGLGSFGAVYKGLLAFEDNPVAIKVFNLNKYGAPTSFNAECEALRYIRHRNLVKIITLCSTVDPNGYDFKALVFQYMPNGSLEMWLHPEDHGHGKQRFLTLGERINVALDIAYALDYLHNQCVSPLIHCDMKPSNVLLDLEMTAYVSDFGLARFMCANSTEAPGNSTSLADLKGSIGYIAPEYGMGAQISTKGDVYSYGVLLLEILTGKRPTDEKFKDGRSLHELVDTAFPHRVTEILDPNMLHNDLDGGNFEMMQSCVLPLVKLALMCSMASPKDRLGMAQVSTEIHSIKQEFLDLSSGGKIARSSSPISLEYRNIRQVRASSYILAISKIASLTALSTNNKMIRLFASFPKLIPLLAVFIFSSSLPLAISDDTDTDREALLCFKSQISDPNGALSSWTNTSLNFCSWQGVSCNNTQTQPRVMALNVSSKGLSGSIPPCIANLSSIASLDLSRNAFLGKIPSELGRLRQISYLNLSINSLEGRIPDELSSCSNLKVLGLSNNSLQGEIPQSLTQCTHLQQAILYNNKLEGSIPTGFGTLPELKTLDLSSNALRGDIPPLLGSSPSFVYVNLGGNQLTGGIPEFLANSSSLQVLRLTQNSLTGEIPPALFNSSTLTTIYLDRLIPDSIGNLAQLTEFHLDGNNFNGSIPSNLGQWRQLEKLDLSHNSFGGSLPSEVFNISSLSQSLDLSHNLFTGPIPLEIGNLINLGSISISNNRLTGEIPSTLGNCVLLEYLHMEGNLLTGSIPQSFMNLKSIKELDLSRNSLSGKVPEFLTLLRYSLPLCRESGSQSKHKSTILKIVIPIAVSVVILLLCLMAVLIKRRKQKPSLQQSSVNMRKISYEDIANATDGFSPTNLVGLGSFGAVYKGMLPFETNPVAIKVFDLNKYGAPTSFNAECEALRYIRHRNLVKIITLCSTIDPNGYDFKALVFQYMPNGSLEMWLHPEDHGHGKKRFLTLGERISLALDIAYALDYLHNQCVSPLIHCDIKPSNVLLDLEMTAYVSDFGLARFMSANSTAAPGNSTSLADLKGSIGYIAPEYGMGGQISTKGDVYSYGVLLLEILTGKRPTDEKFNDGLSLHDRVDAAFPHRVTEILDPNMLHNDLDGGNSELMQSCVLPLVKVALMCSMASPKDRLGMAQVSTEINSIKQAFVDLSSGGKIV